MMHLKAISIGRDKKILLLRRRRPFGFIDHQPSVGMCFVTIRSLERVLLANIS